MKIDKLNVLKNVIMISQIEGGLQTKGNLIIPDDEMLERGLKPRWCKVFKVGSDIKDVQTGDWILVEHGRWSRGIEAIIEGADHTFRIVDPNDILGKQKNDPNVNTI